MSSIYDIYPYVMHNQNQQSEQIIKFPTRLQIFPGNSKAINAYIVGKYKPSVLTLKNR